MTSFAFVGRILRGRLNEMLCSNYLYKQEEQYQDFQYILTLNRDKIESEEQRKLIKMNIDEHQVAVFTKEKKFLRRNYQEK